MKLNRILLYIAILFQLSMACDIEQCSVGHDFNESECKCVEREGLICYLGCPKGSSVFPGERCVCIDDPVCPVQKCKNDKILDHNCNCVNDDWTNQILCKIKCQPGERLIPPCNCIHDDKWVPENACNMMCQPGERLIPPCNCIPIPPNSAMRHPLTAKCSIKRCHSKFRKNDLLCKCEEKPRFFPCSLNCRPDQKVYQGRCKCRPKIKCAIQRCEREFYFNRRRCTCILKKNQF